MNLEKLNPWNWFKHEENNAGKSQQIPVSRRDASGMPAANMSGPNSLLRLHREMDRLFDDVFGSFGMSGMGSGFPSNLLENPSASSSYWPKIDVSGDEQNYHIALDVPGLSESDLSIEVKGDVLTISGHKEEKNESKDKQFYRVERSYGSFQRTLSLPGDANASDIKASLNDGVLTFDIPRTEKPKQDVKRIAINS